MPALVQLRSCCKSDVPDVYKEEVTACLVFPRSGVNVVIATKSGYLVEFKDKIIVRSYHMVDLSGAQVTGLSRILSSDIWVYMVHCVDEQLVMFISGEDLTNIKTYKEVMEVTTSDFLDTGHKLTKLIMLDGDIVLTDGTRELDLDQEWPSTDQDKGEVKGVLEQRLELVRGAVDRARAELELINQQLSESFRGIIGSSQPNAVVDMNEIMEVDDCDEEEVICLNVMRHWVNLVRDKLVVGMELETGSDSVSEIFPSVVTRCQSPLEYSYHLVEDQQMVQRLSARARGFLVVIMAVPTIQTELIVRVEYNKGGNSLLTDKRVICIKQTDLWSKDILPTFTPTTCESSFITLLVTGIQETLTVVTTLGSLDKLYSIISKDPKFTNIPSLTCNLFLLPGHHLHLSGIRIKEKVNSNKLILTVFSKDYDSLDIFVKMFTNLLPADVKFEHNA